MAVSLAPLMAFARTGVVVVVVTGVVSHVMRERVQMYLPLVHVGWLVLHEPPVWVVLEVER